MYATPSINEGFSTKQALSSQDNGQLYIPSTDSYFTQTKDRDTRKLLGIPEFAARFQMNKLINIAITCLAMMVPAWADSGQAEQDRVKQATNVLKEIRGAPDK